MINEEAFLDFKCPHCEELISFPQADTGFARACPMCNETVLVPTDGAEFGSKLPLPLESERLRLRRFGPGDWKDLLEFMSDAELFRYCGGGPLEEEEILRWLEADSHVRLTIPEQMFYLGIELKQEGKLVGFWGIRSGEPLQAGLHVVVGHAYQKKGIAHEGLKLLLRFCFRDLRWHRLSARCDGRNEAALKLFEKAGFRREGEFLEDVQAQEGWASSVWYAMLQREFSAENNPG